MEKSTERLKDKLYGKLYPVHNWLENIFSTASLGMLPISQSQEVYSWCFTVDHHHWKHHMEKKKKKQSS